MALAFHSTPIDLEQIFNWIMENFAYFSRLAHHMLWYSRLFKNGNHKLPDDKIKEAEEFRRRLDDLYWDHDLPLLEYRSRDSYQFRLSEVDVGRLLQPILKQREHGSVFPLFQLPAELRAEIYEYVFQYPMSGICPIRCTCMGWIPRNGRRLSLLSRSFNVAFSPEAWKKAEWDSPTKPSQPSHWPSRHHTGVIAEILSPLLVSSQFYSEAMPIFYEINRFHFTSVSELVGGLRSLSINRRRCLKHLSFRYIPQDLDKRYTLEAFKLMYEMDGLAKLDICLNERSFTDLADGPRVSAFHSFRKLRGLEEVNFHGYSPKLEEILKEDMLKPKKTASEKRKIGRKGEMSCGEGASSKSLKRVRKGDDC